MFRTLTEPGTGMVRLSIDGIEVTASAGETVAAVMLRQADVRTRTTPVTGAPRAPYCMIGVCFDCLAIVDGVHSVQTCLTPVRDGMRVQRQQGSARA